MSAVPFSGDDKHLLGALIRMRALKPRELPAHPILAAQQSSASLPELSAFVAAALNEGSAFMTGYLPQKFQVKSGHKASPPSTAPVEVLSHEIRAADLPEAVHAAGGIHGLSESWFARSSVHDNSATKGTASWDEFDAGLRADHSLREKDYTPSILDAHEVINWKDVLAQINNTVDGWTHVQAYIMEMVHEIPTPLSNRKFNTLVIAGKKDDELLDVQIPVDISAVASAKYNNASKLVLGMYCSVERCTFVDANRQKVKWLMATASDAGGALPMWMQKMGLPGAVVKDVGYFMEWTEKAREGKA